MNKHNNSFGQQALRRGRYSEFGRAYLVTTTTSNRQPIFGSFSAARVVIHEMSNLELNGHVNSLAWVLMPDHLHWLFSLGDKYSLSKTMEILKGRSAVKLNKQLSRNGRVWQKGFHDHALRKEEDVKTVARYIVANPLRAGAG